jgi:hypothetical protein
VHAAIEPSATFYRRASSTLNRKWKFEQAAAARPLCVPVEPPALTLFHHVHWSPSFSIRPKKTQSQPEDIPPVFALGAGAAPRNTFAPMAAGWVKPTTPDDLGVKEPLVYGLDLDGVTDHNPDVVTEH